MGISGKKSESNDYKLREIVQDELGKTFVYDLVEDNIDETSALDQAHIRAKPKKAPLGLITLLIVTVAITTGLNAYMELFASKTVLTGRLDKQEDEKKGGVYRRVHRRGWASYTSEEIPILITGKRLNGSVSLEDREQSYRFKLGNPSSISLSLDGVNSKVEMSLYSDKDGIGLIEDEDNYGYTSAVKSKPGIIKKELGAGNYIVVVRLKAKASNYTLMMSAP